MLRVGPEPSANQSDKTYRGINFPEEYSYTMYGIPKTMLRSTNKGKGYNARLSSGHTTATSTGYRAGSLSGYVPATPTGYRAGSSSGYIPTTSLDQDGYLAPSDKDEDIAMGK